MQDYWFIFDYSMVSIASDTNLIIDEVIEKKSEELTTLTEKQIIKKLKKLKDEFETLPDPLQYIDLNDREMFIDAAKKRAVVYLQRQLLTNAYALKKGASTLEVFAISNLDIYNCADNSTKGFVNEIESEIIHNQEYNPNLLLIWRNLIEKGQIPTNGISNALRYENKEGIISLPWRGYFSEEQINTLRKTMNEQVKRNGNKAETVYRVILAAYSVDCFGEDVPSFHQVETEFDKVNLNKGKYSAVVTTCINGREYKPSYFDEKSKKIIPAKDGIQGLKNIFRYPGRDVEERLKRITDEPYYQFALELYEVLEKSKI